MTNSNPRRHWWSLRKPAYQQGTTEPGPAPGAGLPAEATPYSPPWPHLPVAQRLYAENQMFVDQAMRACDEALRRGF